jgi:hypothetical protein
VGASRQHRRFDLYHAAAGPAATGCAPNSHAAAEPTFLQELRFLRKVLRPAVAETVTEAPHSSVVTAEEGSAGSAAVDARSPWMAIQLLASWRH